jgi:hypothetical protein
MQRKKTLAIEGGYMICRKYSRFLINIVTIVVFPNKHE